MLLGSLREEDHVDRFVDSLREEDNVARFVETENHIASFIKEKRVILLRFVEGRGSYY